MADKTTKITKINKTPKTKTKRLSKGQRTHIRRLKQEAGNPAPVHK